ncbi:MAG: hypothetical protein ACLUNO_11725 [Oscillospiraceae bacterium]
MKRSRLLPALLLALLMLLPAGCGTQTTGAPQQTPTPTETATVSGAAGTLRVQVPDGWKYEDLPRRDARRLGDRLRREDPAGQRLGQAVCSCTGRTASACAARG